MTTYRAWRAPLLHCIADPDHVGIEQSYQYIEDGLLITCGDRIQFCGKAEDGLKNLPNNLSVTQVENGLLIPGLIDTHVHYPQTDMIASYGEQLLDWLERYTFPEETQFADANHAGDVAERFLNELLRNGTTTALVFGTVHKTSVEVFFEAAAKRRLRMICGKVLMDRNAPDTLLDTPESAYSDSKALIERWHGQDRLHYAVTPRFAPTSTDEQLAVAGRLLAEYEGLYLHTHLAENHKECEWVQSLFPESQDYLDVYDRHHLLSERSVFAHGIHLSDDAHQRLHHSGSAIAFCPSSNLFLGSGLFPLSSACQHGVNVGLGTDVGAGTSFSLLSTMGDAYKTQQLQGQSLHPMKAFYLATLGGAKALRLEDKIGNLAIGSEADFVILDYQATPLLKQRLPRCQSIEEILFTLMILGDDRVIKATIVAGEPIYQRDKI